MPETPGAYPFTYDFQRGVLALSAQDPSFILTHRECLKPSYFGYRDLQVFAGLLLRYFDEHGASPDWTAAAQLMNDAVGAGRAGGMQTEAALELVEWSYTTEVPDVGFLRDRAVKFARQQALKAAVLHGFDVLKREGDPEEAMKMFEQAMTIGVAQDPGADLFDDIDRLPEMWAEMVRCGGSIPTKYFPSIDEALYGGPRRGELYVVQGTPKAGKSGILVGLGAAALEQGYKVLHITIGDLKQVDVELRYAARLTGIAMKEIMWNNPMYANTLDRVALSPNQMRIRYYPPETLTCAHIRSYMSWLGSRYAFRPDMLVVDYPDEMQYDRSQAYNELGRIYAELKHILDDFNCVGWIASQSNRSAAAAADNSTRYMAESWKKLASVDGAIPICMTDKEREEGKLRLFCENFRFGKDHFMVECAFDFSCWRVWQTDKTPGQVDVENRARLAQIAQQMNVAPARSTLPAQTQVSNITGVGNPQGGTRR